ncbi:MAG: hypothetical protein VYC39_15690 [Myxococcota bacterium]|nr:hypothetical protein [Myxococcota bacterium]
MVRGWYVLNKVSVIGLLFVLAACDTEEVKGPPCDMSGQCLPSFVCQSGICIPANESLTTSNCGPEGCEVALSNEAILLIPPLALTTSELITFTSVGRGSVGNSWSPLSSVFLIEPDRLLFQAPATIEFRVDPSWGLSGGDLVVYWSPDLSATWKPLTGGFDDETVRGELGQSGYVFVARR